MTSSKLIVILFIVGVFLLTGFKEPFKESKAAQKVRVEKWTGTVTWMKTSRSKARQIVNTSGHEDIYTWDKFFVFRIHAEFINNKGTIIRKDTTKNWGLDSLWFTNPNVYTTEETTTRIFCDGKETLELEVKWDENRKNYWLSFETPDCRLCQFHKRIHSLQGIFIDTLTGENPRIQLTLPANFTGHPVGNNPNVLSGKWDELIPAPNDPGGGDIIIRSKCDLKKS